MLGEALLDVDCVELLGVEGLDAVVLAIEADEPLGVEVGA